MNLEQGVPSADCPVNGGVGKFLQNGTNLGEFAKLARSHGKLGCPSRHLRWASYLDTADRPSVRGTRI